MHSTTGLAAPALLLGLLTTAAFGGEPRTIRAHDADAWRIAFSADGRWLATASLRKEDSPKVWDVASGKLVQDLGRSKGGFVSLCFTADGEQLITGTLNYVQSWDVAT